MKESIWGKKITMANNMYIHEEKKLKFLSNDLLDIDIQKNLEWRDWLLKAYHEDIVLVYSVFSPPFLENNYMEEIDTYISKQDAVTSFKVVQIPQFEPSL